MRHEESRVTSWMMAVAGLLLAGCETPRRGPATPPEVNTARTIHHVPEAPAGEVRDISPHKARALLKQDAGLVYLDVRTVEEFRQGHVPEAWNVPVVFLDPETKTKTANEHFVRVVTANFDREAPMIVGCRTGGRSAIAVRLLREAGFRNVLHMHAGFIGKHDQAGRLVQPGWARLGYTIETSDGGERRYDALMKRISP